MQRTTLGLGATRESSVIVSLQELMLLESERLESEKRAENERILAEKQRAEAATARLVAEERERLRALEWAREEKERHERAELARLEAIRAAELEHQREQLRMQREQARREREHELTQNLALDAEKVSRAGRNAGLGLLAMVFLGATFLGARAWGEQNRKHAAELRELRRQINPSQAELPPPSSQQKLPPDALVPAVPKPSVVEEPPANTKPPKSNRLERLTPRPPTECQKGDPMCGDF